MFYLTVLNKNLPPPEYAYTSRRDYVRMLEENKNKVYIFNR